jgi:hypothetical protein
MDEVSSPAIQPVPEQPPEQEFQTRNLNQLGQDRTPDNPPTAGVSQRRALEGKAIPGQQDFVPTPATTIEEVLKAAYFVADGIDAPLVDAVNPHVINLHYPADGSLATIRVEGRSGAWGGIAHKGTPEEDADRNAHYEEMKAAAAAPPASKEELAGQESYDDAHAREDSKPQEPREEPSPVWQGASQEYR